MNETITISRSQYDALIRVLNALAGCNEAGLLDAKTSQLAKVNNKVRQEARAALVNYNIPEKPDFLTEIKSVLDFTSKIK
jgi:hypothetical protein